MTTKREIKERIYLSGSRGDYQVNHHMTGENIICYVPSVSIGNTIVRALRERAQSKATEFKEKRKDA